MQITNIFSLKEIPAFKEEEYFESLFEKENLRIERIVSHGQVSAPGNWYEQESNEWVVLLRGKATLEFEQGRLVHLKAGDSLMLEAGLKHRVAFTSKEPACVWIAVHFK